MKETLFLFGGTGCMGKYIISQYINKYTIINYSRDEHKHWQLDQFYGKSITHIIGDAIDTNNVTQSLITHNPHKIFILHALKHVDRCQKNLNACINTNLLSIKNVLDSIHLNVEKLSNLREVIFLSTDKATSPINAYGMSKALCECFMEEKSQKISNIKFVTVRYGNVLNSTSSLLPILKNNISDTYYLTDERMCRFWMTVHEAFETIEYACNNGNTGEIIIPIIPAFYVKDLINIFAEKLDKKVVISGLRPGERLYESLINDTQSLRAVRKEKFYHIVPEFKIDKLVMIEPFEYTSKTNIITRNELEQLLIQSNAI